MSVVPDDLRADVKAFIETYLEDVAKNYERGLLRTHALVFALQDPETGEPYEEGMRALMLEGELTKDKYFLSTVRQTMRHSLALAVAWVTFGHKRKPKPGEPHRWVMISLEFLRDNVFWSWMAPIVAHGSAKKLGPFVTNPAVELPKDRKTGPTN